jgi:DNA polymerase elongation subunit (family B)
MQNILDKRQLGYKVTANSLYGQCGSRTSTFYEKDIAASTTATGRSMIVYAKRIIEVYENRGYDTVCHGPVLTNAEYVYGDSVASYTPIQAHEPRH